jgi:hypothetical protein
MKLIYVTLTALFVTLGASAKTIKAIQNNYWESAGSWDLNRLPQDNDSIVIPAGYTITLDVNVQLNNVVLVIYGTLQFNNGKLRLDNASQILIEPNGTITGINSNDQITIGSTLKFSGTELIKYGYSSASSSTGTSPYGFTSSILPVVFQSFYATRQGSNVQLSWTTSAELNNSSFEVERSTDGTSWKAVAEMSGAGTSTTINQYSYTDKNVSETTVYYRIKQVDVSGSYTYSAIRTIHSSGNTSGANVYGSGKQTIVIDFNSDIKNNVSVQIVNINGQIISKQQYSEAPYRLTVNLPAGGGVYVVQLSDGAGWREVKKVIL